MWGYIMGTCGSKPVSSDEAESIRTYMDMCYEGQKRSFCGNKMEDVLPLYDEAIKFAPREQWAYLNKAGGLAKLNREREARKVLKQAEQNGGHTVAFLYSQAFVEDPSKKSAQFAATAMKIVNMKPKSYVDIRAQYFAYEALGNLQKSLDILSEIIKFPEAEYDFYMHFALGVAYQQLERFDEALAAFKKSVSIMPSGLACYYIAQGLEYKRDFKEAIKYYEKALEIEPQDPLYIVGLGICQYDSGNMKAALKSFNKAFTAYNDPENKSYLTSGNREYIEEVFSTERAELLHKFEELTKEKIEPINLDTSSFALSEAVKVMNQEILKYNTDLASAEKKYINSFSQNSEIRSEANTNISDLKGETLVLMNNKVKLQQEYAFFQSASQYSDNLRMQDVKLFNYYDGLAYTFTSVFTDNQVTSVGKHELNNSNFLVNGVAELVSSAPFGAIVGKAITTVYGFAKSAQIKKQATNASKIASTSAECCELVMCLNTKLIADSRKLDEIKHASDVRPEGGFICKIWNKLKSAASSLETAIEGNRFSSNEAKLGREDALKLIMGLHKGDIWRENTEVSDSFVGKMYDYVLAGEIGE